MLFLILIKDFEPNSNSNINKNNHSNVPNSSLLSIVMPKR